MNWAASSQNLPVSLPSIASSPLVPLLRCVVDGRQFLIQTHFFFQVSLERLTKGMMGISASPMTSFSPTMKMLPAKMWT
ncbi:hypothetical protein L6452_39292 [Arctium lappa]|uniref:Uncharacterized protein n=1 Tax=Arctium lappa TaxID=4217 RepID=A0ACB8XRX0_ARCLA|nr:hypothetical protein L6452_39292 [Arctium lappa]